MAQSPLRCPYITTAVVLVFLGHIKCARVFIFSPFPLRPCAAHGVTHVRICLCWRRPPRTPRPLPPSSPALLCFFSKNMAHLHVPAVCHDAARPVGGTDRGENEIATFASAAPSHTGRAAHIATNVTEQRATAHEYAPVHADAEEHENTTLSAWLAQEQRARYITSSSSCVLVLALILFLDRFREQGAKPKLLQFACGTRAATPAVFRDCWLLVWDEPGNDDAASTALARAFPALARETERLDTSLWSMLGPRCTASWGPRFTLPSVDSAAMLAARCIQQVEEAGTALPAKRQRCARHAATLPPVQRAEHRDVRRTSALAAPPLRPVGASLRAVSSFAPRLTALATALPLLLLQPHATRPAPAAVAPPSALSRPPPSSVRVQWHPYDPAADDRRVVSRGRKRTAPPTAPTTTIALSSASSSFSFSSPSFCPSSTSDSLSSSAASHLPLARSAEHPNASQDSSRPASNVHSLLAHMMAYGAQTTPHPSGAHDPCRARPTSTATPTTVPPPQFASLLPLPVAGRAGIK